MLELLRVEPTIYTDFLVGEGAIGGLVLVVPILLFVTQLLSRHIVGINYATTKHSLRAALQLSPSDVQRRITLNYSYLPVLVKLSN